MAPTNDVSEDYVNALLGQPPGHWREKVQKAQELCRLVEESGRFGKLEEMEDVFLIAALAFYSSRDLSMAGIVTRVRQIVKWHARKANEVVDAVAKFGPASLPVLENKGQELARMIAKHLFSTEGFLLLVFQHGTPERPGYTTHCSSVDRRAQIRLLEEHLANLRAMLRASD